MGSISASMDNVSEARAQDVFMPDKLRQEIIDLQEDLKASEARFYNVVNISPTGVVVINRLRTICFINDSAQKIFGRRKETLLGQKFEPLFVPGETTEIEIPGAEAESLIAEMRVVEIVWEKQLAYLVSLQDMSESTRLNNELNRANRDLVQFSYAVSHDIKAPLRGVKTLAGWLKEDYAAVLSARAIADLTLMDGNVDRILRLSEGLLQFAQIGVSDRALEPVELNDVFTEALDNINSDILGSGAEISIDQLPSVQANYVQLVLLFQSLLSNSIKYQNDLAPIISVRAKKRQRYWEISITDNGIGIDEQHWDKIFVAFERLHTNAEYDGSGIGLATCKKIVDQLNGHIWVDSEPGVGSTFYVLLPETAMH